ncbi:MAG: DUF3179 domain-containing (seleno)protein, partial [SAR202 cluster bacterium]|nr:DUF3179 domain-containing (seleno)protein [SAR202 cluster bacterium]
REFCTSGSAGGPGGVIPWGYPTYISLEFYVTEGEDFAIRDRQTESTWDAQGNAVFGPLEGNVLKFVPSFISEWYGWSGYHPETQLFAQAP